MSRPGTRSSGSSRPTAWRSGGSRWARPSPSTGSRWNATHPSAKAPNYELAIHEIEDLVRELCHLWAAIGKIKEDRALAPDLNAAEGLELGRNEGPASPPLPAEE